MSTVKKPARIRNVNGRPRKIGMINPYVLVLLLSPESRFSSTDEIRLSSPEILNKLNEYFKKSNRIKEDLTYDGFFNVKKSPLYKPLKLCIYGPPPANSVYIRKPLNRRPEIFGDIIQGAALDAYFLAALYSMVWINYPAFPPAANNIGFYPGAGSAKQAVPVTPTFPLDNNGKLIYAQLSPAPDNEYWGPAWEKAYAEFKNLPRSTCAGASGVQGVYPYDPEIGAFPCGDPLESLTDITGRAYTFTPLPPNNTVNTTAYNINPQCNPDCYAILTHFNSNNVSGSSAMTKYPTVAWTKNTCPNFSPALVASHAYSILGRFTSGAKRYIVLRNPWGVQFNTNILASLAQAGAYLPANVYTAIDLGPVSTKGIFAIENTAFNAYFAGFGWVK